MTNTGSGELSEVEVLKEEKGNFGGTKIMIVIVIV